MPSPNPFRSKLQRLGIIRPPLPWHKEKVLKHNAESDTVILLHGLWRSFWTMEPMAQHLHQKGYHTVNIPYPSFTKSMDDLVEYIENIIQKYQGQGKIHFVTHSLGGIIARELFSRLNITEVGRLVMLAPPNQGSEIIDWLEDSPLFRLALGPAGMQLSSDKIKSPPIPHEIEAAIIMGNQSMIPFFRDMLDDENDGIVSVEKGKLEGMNEFHVMDADHTFITSDPNVMSLTSHFIQHGPQKADD